MGIIEIILIAFGLAMDAFAVAVCKGLAIRKINFKKIVKVGLWFGIFQAFMPILGFLLGNSFAKFMQAFSNWIAFVLLTWIGINMLRELNKKEGETINEDISAKKMFPLAIATSIDALMVGITFSFLKINILTSALCIGIITFLLSMLGVKVGNRFGDKYEKKAQIIGGILLIGLGVKSLI